MKRVWKSAAGFSIIEVLIGATVFMIGFSTLVLMLSNVFARFSIEEMELANVTSQRIIDEAVMLSDTTSFDSTIVCSGLSMRVQKQVIVVHKLARISVTVWREANKRKLIKLYNEFLICQEQ